MLKNLIKPAWHSEDVDARHKAISNSDPKDAKHRAALIDLASHDSDAGVKRAAMVKLCDPLEVWKLSQAHLPNDTGAIAESVLAQLLADTQSISAETAKELAHTHAELKDSIVCFSAHAELRAELLESYSLEQQTELIADIAFTDTRQQIAHALASQALLERARYLLKGKDKSAEKIIRQKLDLIHEQEKIEQQQYLAASEICEKMEFVAAHQDDPDFSAKVSVWQQRWDSLDFEPADELTNRFNSAAQSASATVSELLASEKAQAQQMELSGVLDQYCTELTSKTAEQLNAMQGEILARHAQAVKQWNALAEKCRPEPKLAAHIANTKAGLASLAKFIANESLAQQESASTLRNSLKQLTWPAHLPPLQVAAQARERLDELSADKTATDQAKAKKLDQLHKRINRLLGTSKRGDLVKAKGELAAVTKSAEQFKGKDKASLDERLAQAAELVSQMADWKDFATAPKFIELCEAMEALQNSKQHPDKLAAKISALQNQWKELGHCESADAHWDRFKQAADVAYQPCADFFAKRHAQRQKNLELREPLVNRMRALLEGTDWQAEPDYKNIERELQNIHRDWQKIKDVERGPGQKQWKRISKLRTAVYAKLDLVYDANIEIKQNLIEQAKAMLQSELTADPIAKLKHLQGKWKEVGVTRRKQDQVAWKEFCAATDAVFEQIQSKRHEKRAEEDQHVAAHRQVIKSIQTLAKSAESLAEADHKFEELINEFNALPAFPKGLNEKLIERINADFQRAENNFGKTRERLLKEQKQGAFALLRRKADLCTELESLNPETDAAQVSELLDKLGQIDIANKEHRERMETRIANALSHDKTKANGQRRMMCIDLEILLGVDSPAQDAALRMQTQLERMKSKGLGQGQIQSNEKLAKMKIDWLCLDGAEPELQQALDKRFWALIKKA